MYSGTFRWTEMKDKILLREVRFVEPYQFKAGSKESGQAWSEVAGAVNQYDGFKVMPRDQRSVRDRFNKLLGDYKTKMRKEEGESGTNPEPLSEAEIILQEIEEKMKSAKIDLVSTSAKESEQQKNERKKAMAVRDAAMKTWGKSKGITNSDEEEGPSEKPKRRKRRSGGNALQYLEAKCQADAEVKKEEVALRQQELALQQKRQEQFEAQMLQQQPHLQQQALQQQQQFNLQRQQMQQTQNLILALLQKVSKE